MLLRIGTKKYCFFIGLLWLYNKDEYKSLNLFECGFRPLRFTVVISLISWPARKWDPYVFVRIGKKTLLWDRA